MNARGDAPPPRTPFRELAGLFLKLGTVAFGGPAAHVALMEDEVVRRRRWLSREQFLDYLGATNLIPGPNSTELAIHIGHARAGWPGLLVAGACFILPAALIVTAVAWIYVRFGSLPAAAGILYGVKPVVIAVVLQALWRLGRTAVRSRELAALGVGAVIATALGVNELAVLAAAGLVMAVARGIARDGRGRLPAMHGITGTAGGAGAAAGAATATVTAAVAATAAGPGTLTGLFVVFVKIGAVLFGSGYVLLAFLRADLVERLRWLTERQLLDAVAVGQVTPGPVFTTATFVGYLLAGPGGAAVATVGIFLPAFVFVALSGPLIPRLRRSPLAGAVLDGVNVASLALMAVVTWQLGRAAIVDGVTLGLALASAGLLFYGQVNSAWLVAAGAGVGLGIAAVR
ncbi:MAG TPA: chromate efflux transporter [Gemmatimonadales bacterium]|nr:chromate efflux transporter [Gemmatimonadales bacterium]